MTPWSEFLAQIKESWKWLSVQVTAGWGTLWAILALLPGNVLAEMSQIHFLSLSLVGWMGIGQTVSTYFARVKPPKSP